MPTAELAPTTAQAPQATPPQSATQLPLTAGVELECSINGGAGNLVHIRDVFRTAGLQANVTADIDRLYTAVPPAERVPSNWRQWANSAWLMAADCSSGGEMKSPIFTTYEDMVEQITKACKLLKDNRYAVDSYCGLHVHLGTGVKTNAEVSRFHQLLYRNEDTFFRLVPRSRRDNNYCRIFDRYVIDEHGQRLSEALSKETWSSRPWFHFSNKNTTEVRLQLGSLDAERIISWVCFLQQCWRSSQVDRSYDPQWKVLRMIDVTPPSVISGFPTPSSGTRVAMRMIRSKHHDEIYRRARDYAYNYASVS